MSEQEFGEIIGLPDPKPGTCYIVSAIVLAAAKEQDRTDCLAPDTARAVRNEKGEFKMKLEFDKELFRWACRSVRQVELAPVIGIRVSNLSMKLKNCENIKLTDFLKICEYLDEDPMRFITKLESESKSESKSESTV